MRGDLVSDHLSDQIVERSTAFAAFVEDCATMREEGWGQIAGLCRVADGSNRTKASQGEMSVDLPVRQGSMTEESIDHRRDCGPARRDGV